MANRRMINKDDMDSPHFGELSIQQRYLFWAIMLNADDDGIMPVDLVRAKCFPYDSISMEEIKKDLDKLRMWNFILIYHEHKYLAVLNWWSRQFIDNKIYKPTSFPHYSGYSQRPKDLTKRRGSGKPLDKIRKEKVSLDQNILVENSLGEVSSEVDQRMYQQAEDIFYNDDGAAK